VKLFGVQRGSEIAKPLAFLEMMKAKFVVETQGSDQEV
jgi:hypothetical protein